MDGLHLLFTRANSSDLAVWARLFGTLALFGERLLIQNFWQCMNVLQHVCTCQLGPMRSLLAYIEGMDGLHLLFMGANGSKRLAWARFGTLVLFLDDTEFSAACCNIVFGTHEKPFGIY